MKKFFNNFKRYFKDNKGKCLTILTIIILSILSSIILISYSFYQNKSRKLIISGIAVIGSNDVTIKVYRQDRDENGNGLVIGDKKSYSLTYYIPSDTYYTYNSSLNKCSEGLKIISLENRVLRVDATKKGTCEIYFDLKKSYTEDSSITLYVQKEANNVEKKNYTRMGQLPTDEIGYNYSINEDLSTCEPSTSKLSIVGRTISINSSEKTKCSVYVNKNIDNEKPTINILSVTSGNIIAQLNDNVSVAYYGFSNSNTVEPVDWILVTKTPFILKSSVSSSSPYLWVKDGANNIFVSDKINISKKGYETILANNNLTILSVPTLDTTAFATSTTNTSNSGIFKYSDDFGDSYYFRGYLNNNWLKFGNYTSNVYDCGTTISSSNTGSCTKIAAKGDFIYWRIIRINGNGSIRLIYSGTSAPTSSNSYAITGSGTQIGTCPYNSSSDKSEYVGYQYILGQQHGYGTNSVDSLIKKYLEKWYTFTSLNTADSKFVSSEIFCQDRNVTNSEWSSTTSDYFQYASVVRLNSSSPVPLISCLSSKDSFSSETINYNNNVFGNGAISKPVGLITADEMALAGYSYNYNNPTSYNYLKTGLSYWTMTADSIFSTYTSNCCEYQGIIGSCSVDSADTGVRPVINLISNISLSGNGTYSSVYTVS